MIYEKLNYMYFDNLDRNYGLELTNGSIAFTQINYAKQLINDRATLNT